MTKTTENYVTTDEEFHDMMREIRSSNWDKPMMVPLRQMRAQRITSQLMRILDKHLRHDPDISLRKIHEDILDMFFKADVDIVTEIDRINAELPRRNAYGFTREEMVIMENKKIEAMLKPFPQLIPEIINHKTQCPKCGEMHNV